MVTWPGLVYRPPVCDTKDFFDFMQRLLVLRDTVIIISFSLPDVGSQHAHISWV